MHTEYGVKLTWVLVPAPPLTSYVVSHIWVGTSYQVGLLGCEGDPGFALWLTDAWLWLSPLTSRRLRFFFWNKVKIITNYFNSNALYILSIQSGMFVHLMLLMDFKFYFYKVEVCFSARCSTIYCHNRCMLFFLHCFPLFVLLSLLLNAFELPYAVWTTTCFDLLYLFQSLFSSHWSFPVPPDPG